jgi:hypothetical protein
VTPAGQLERRHGTRAGHSQRLDVVVLRDAQHAVEQRADGVREPVGLVAQHERHPGRQWRVEQGTLAGVEAAEGEPGGAQRRAALLDGARAQRRRPNATLAEASTTSGSIAGTPRRGSSTPSGAGAGDGLLAEARLRSDLDAARTCLAQARQTLAAALVDQRDLGRVIHPGALTDGRLRSALEDLAFVTPTPVQIFSDLDGQRLPTQIEEGAYYVIAELLPNVAKYAHAMSVTVELSHPDGSLQVVVRDDGRGGADPARGTGLHGLSDRVHAVRRSSGPFGSVQVRRVLHICSTPNGQRVRVVSV